MNPPLRTQRDIDALIEGVADRTITVALLRHAPHANFEKEVEFDRAPLASSASRRSLASSWTSSCTSERRSTCRA
jgi:dihydroorotase-like cyclic amidohydrolase